MGKVPKMKPKKVSTPGSYRYPQEAKKRSGTASKKGEESKKRKSGGNSSSHSDASGVKKKHSSGGKGRPAQKRKGTARKDNYRYNATTIRYLPAEL
jgi:hypothetical protein